MALKRQHDLERLKLSLEDAGLADLFDVLNRELGVESLHDVRLLEGEDLDTLAKLPIVKRKRLKVWVRNQHPLHQARRAVETYEPAASELLLLAAGALALGAAAFHVLEGEICSFAPPTAAGDSPAAPAAAAVCGPRLSLVDSLYLSAMTLTTIGFGDLTPTTPESKVFMMVFSLLGLGIFSAFTTAIGAWREALPRTAFGAATVMGILMAAGTALFVQFENLEPLDAAYLTLTTVTTIGYGDLKPTTDLSKLAVVAFALLSLGAAGAIASSIGEGLLRLLRHLHPAPAKFDAAAAAADKPKTD